MRAASFWSTLDFWVGTFLILVMATIDVDHRVQRVFGIDAGWDEIHEGSQIPIARVFRLILKFVAPGEICWWC